MFCPSCGTQNLPTDLRCLRCGTSLVGETVGGSAEYKRAAAPLNRRMISGVAGMLGFVLTFIVCKTIFGRVRLSDLEILGAAFVVAYVCRLLARYIEKEWNDAA